jgi:hypothetical protein
MSCRYGQDGAFVIEGYDQTPPFMSFLPGLAGETGIPMWLYYANRGQGVCSFGVEDKDHAIMEFSPANTALKRVASEGFRTFLRINGRETEPFSPAAEAPRTLKLYQNAFHIMETGEGFEFTVRTFTLPGEDFSALVRCCELTNTSGSPASVSALDGLTQIIPYGVTNSTYKSVSNLFKSWAHVSGLETGVPLYHTRSMPGDEAEVGSVKGGYFSLSFAEDGKPITPFIDPNRLFDEAFTKPREYPEKAGEGQIFSNRYACAFTPLKSELAPGGSLTWVTLIGFTADPEKLWARAKSLCDFRWVERKYREALARTGRITDAVTTETAEPLFDGYIRQSYLDNILRGGDPKVLGGKVLHLYGRKHGDPERDYNFFSLSAEYFSQGNGNFRDVCQNRRSDVFFCPEAGEVNIKTFFTLVQADGFNPLEVRGAAFGDGMGRSFTAGQFITNYIKEHGAALDEAVAKLEETLPGCEQLVNAAFGEGYWIDHWTYLLDLVESFLMVFPERKDALLSAGGYRFFHSPVRILPRREAYVRKGETLRQYKSLEHIEGRPHSAFLKNRDGSFAEVTLLGKMAILALIKFSSLDPLGRGLEMDGGKPGWNDAMNGLPGLFGSGVGEAYELKRLLRFLLTCPGEVTLPAEAAKLYRDLVKIQSIGDPFRYWDASAAAKEEYRASVLNTLTGKTETVSWREGLETFLARLDRGLSEAEAMDTLVPTYLTYEPTGLDETGFPTGFACRALPPFLEGPARQLKTAPGKAKEVYAAVRGCDLYDKKLGMYKTSVSLEGETYDIGRVRAFTPGWLERESVFLHMSLKYLLELLRAGLYDEFYEDIRTGLPPFLDPAVYGRNPLENSSFIASSVNPDPSAAGRGFVARLSGSTAEMLSVWLLMFLGGKAFSVTPGGTLRLTFAPALKGSFFPENGEVRFSLFRTVPVTYRNPSRVSTYGTGAARPVRTAVAANEKTYIFEGGYAEGEAALAIREGRAASVTVDFI